MATGTAGTAARTPAVARIRETPLLRWTLELDGIATALNGLVYVLAAGWVGDHLGLPTALLYPAGAFLVVVGALVFTVSTRREAPVLWVGAILVLNAVWAIDSVIVAAAGWFDPTTAGTVWILLQAGLVALFAVLQWAGLKRARR
ncbi:hypothetical protein E1262_01260 [Jiangella aurantiaca]|uniref:Integral membrane protein n=1 Tax=Jiangella aurantiaca TaxID=2530373 RepID=A0A4V2YTB8_9ACTN|nr:hypothetical protein [Jiangella aurantiaca]TDD73137.1 hypothetical protein E1262_01260 [Jiangella aurantiaca]